MKNNRNILIEAFILIDVATSLAKKQLPEEDEKKVMKHVQYLLAEQLVYHAQAARKLK